MVRFRTWFGRRVHTLANELDVVGSYERKKKMELCPPGFLPMQQYI